MHSRGDCSPCGERRGFHETAVKATGKQDGGDDKRGYFLEHGPEEVKRLGCGLLCRGFHGLSILSVISLKIRKAVFNEAATYRNVCKVLFHILMKSYQQVPSASSMGVFLRLPGDPDALCAFRSFPRGMHAKNGKKKASEDSDAFQG